MVVIELHLGPQENKLPMQADQEAGEAGQVLT